MSSDEEIDKELDEIKELVDSSSGFDEKQESNEKKHLSKLDSFLKKLKEDESKTDSETEKKLF